MKDEDIGLIGSLIIIFAVLHLSLVFFPPHVGTGICGTRAREALCGPQANKATAAAAPALCVTLARISQMTSIQWLHAVENISPV